MRILLVEDEENIRDVVRLNLELEGYEVLTAESGVEGLKNAEQGQFDLLVLDVMLPGIDGFEICRRIREQGNKTPVLFLTARGDSKDRVHGLKIGADDYLVKPFDLEEMLLRVKNLLSRSTSTTGRISFGGNTVHFNTYTAETYDGKKIQLTQREVQLIKFLAGKAGHVVSRNEILDNLWGEDALVTGRTVDNYIVTFRKHFERNPREPRHFHSVRGVGYRFSSEG